VKKLRVAVVGVGYLGRFHAQKHRALDSVELVAVCDKDAERCRSVAAEVGIDRNAQIAAFVQERMLGHGPDRRMQS